MNLFMFDHNNHCTLVFAYLIYSIWNSHFTDLSITWEHLDLNSSYLKFMSGSLNFYIRQQKKF